MSDDASIDCRLSAALDIVTFQAIAGGQFRILNPVPDWWHAFSMRATDHTACRPDQIFPYLEDFLHDLAREASPLPRRLSGIWQETAPEGIPWQLEASAFELAGHRFVCIERLRSASEDRHTILQRGRESQLRYESVLEQQRRLQIELLRAKEAAENLNRAKSHFLANMSHEIRTPLHGILGMTQLAIHSKHDSRQTECLLAAHQSAQILLEIVNDILDLSKIEAGKLELEHEPFALQTVLTEIVTLFQPRAQEKQLSLTWQVQTGVPDWLVGDPLRLRQIINNLVGNAIKFTARGEVAIRVRPLDADDPESLTLEFSVQDSGIGMSTDQQQRVFEPFEQGDSSTARKYGGTGLGLSICQHLVRRMEGTISVESQLGQGSTFRFTARLGRAPSPSPSTGSDAWGAGAAPPSPAVRLRVLMAEDNRINQRLATWVLEERGHQVDLVESGEAVLERLSQRRYDVCLMDCQMPGLDGYETTRRIRAAERPPDHLPVIALTAGAMKSDRERCLAAGMDHYLAKPFQPNELIAAVENAINFTDNKTWQK